MAIACDVYENCDKEIILDVIKLPKNFRSLNCRWRNDEKNASRPIKLYPEFFSTVTVAIT